MSEIPNGALDGGEELDLGEVDEEADGDATETDASADDEGAEDDGDGQGQDEGQEGDVEPPSRGRRPGRSERLRERLERTERELAEARGFRQAAEQFQRQPQQPQVNYEAERVAKWEADNLPMMSAQEVSAYHYNKLRNEAQQTLILHQLQMQDTLDKRDFANAARTSKLHAQYKDAVEREVAAETARGILQHDREAILDRLHGRASRENAERDAPRQRKAAAARVRAQRTQPTNGRGDGASGGGRQNSFEKDYALAIEGMRKGYF